MFSYHRGFTLIELLVVTSIIGVIAGIVLAALTNARNRSFDTAVKDNLGNARTQAGIFHSNNGNYGDGVGLSVTDCFTSATSMFASDPVMESMINAAEDASKAGDVQCTTDTLPGSPTNVWSVQAPLMEGNIWCVDSEGSAKIVSTNAVSGVCP